jgi:hypothetical protein
MAGFIDSHFFKSILAGIIAGTIVGSAAYKVIKDVIWECLKDVPQRAILAGETVMKSSVVTSEDGTSYYKYRTPTGQEFLVVEEKNGKTKFMYTGPQR